MKLSFKNIVLAALLLPISSVSVAGMIETDVQNIPFTSDEFESTLINSTVQRQVNYNLELTSFDTGLGTLTSAYLDLDFSYFARAYTKLITENSNTGSIQGYGSVNSTIGVETLSGGSHALENYSFSGFVGCHTSSDTPNTYGFSTCRDSKFTNIYDQSVSYNLNSGSLLESLNFGEALTLSFDTDMLAHLYQYTGSAVNPFVLSTVQWYDVSASVRYIYEEPTAPVDVPEPSSLLIFTLGLLGLASRQRGKKA